MAKETSSNFTFKCDEELSPSIPIPGSKPNLISVTEDNMANSHKLEEKDEFVPRENFEELSRMYRVLQSELNKAFDALLEFKNFEEKHNGLITEYEQFKFAHSDCDNRRPNFTLEKECQMLRIENEQLKNKNKRAKNDLHELSQAFEKGIEQLKQQLMSSNQELENENQQLRKENADLQVKQGRCSFLETQLQKNLKDLEDEKKQLKEQVANNQTKESESKCKLTRLAKRTQDRRFRQNKIYPSLFRCR